MLDCDDLDEVIVEHPVKDLERKIVDQAMAYAQFLRNRGQQRPTDRVRDDILDGHVYGESESLAESFAFVFVLESGGTKLEPRRPEDPRRVFTGHASESVSAPQAAGRALHPTMSNRSRWRPRPRVVA